MTEFWLIITNLGIIAATGLLVYVTVRDAHHHEEKVLAIEDSENERLVAIIDKVIEEEREHDRAEESRNR